jgi:hypothetical protein
MTLPGRCQVCGGDVAWNGKMWRDIGQRGKGRHVCPDDRPRCNMVMRNALERCARLPGHTTEHRTAYALANARRMRTGRAA